MAYHLSLPTRNIKDVHLFIENFLLTYSDFLDIITHRKFPMKEVSVLEQIYIDTAKVLKAISDPKRLRIVDMLSCGELCACKILEAFHITQPTLSHDMRVLIEAGIVNDRREGKNIFYSLNHESLTAFQNTLRQITTPKSNCVCKSGECCA